jgi:hypothetical protein
MLWKCAPMLGEADFRLARTVHDLYFEPLCTATRNAEHF